MVHAFAGADDGEESEGSGIGHEQDALGKSQPAGGKKRADGRDKNGVEKRWIPQPGRRQGPQQKVAQRASAESGHRGQHDDTKKIDLTSAGGEDSGDGGGTYGEVFEDGLGGHGLQPGGRVRGGRGFPRRLVMAANWRRC